MSARGVGEKGRWCLMFLSHWGRVLEFLFGWSTVCRAGGWGLLEYESSKLNG